MSVKILLVDDHELIRQGIRALLERHPGFEIIGEAGDGRSAVQQAIELKPDVIVLDIELPDIDGIEVTRQIVDNNSPAKILALSIHSERGIVSKTFACGALGYILKDSALEELIKAIETVVSEEKYLSPSLIDVVLNDHEANIPSTRKADTSKLTPRELEILKFIAEGYSSKEIAFTLNLSAKTVDAHRHTIMSKLDIHNIADLTRFAVRERLVDL